jgi:hypothetical protein
LALREKKRKSEKKSEECAALARGMQ